MNYTLHQLKIFISVCETGSITKSSEEMFLTQPAISLQLKKFQEQFEIPLTELVGRKLRITNFGLEIKNVCLRIIEETERIEQTMLEYQGLLAGEIKFACVSTGKYVLPYFLERFTNDNPAVNIFIDVTNKAEVVREIEQRECDFALVSVLPDGNYEKVSLMENELILAAAPTIAEKYKNGMTADDLSKERIIFREEGSATRNAMENFLKKEGISPDKKMILRSNEAVKQALLAGLGVSVLPKIGILDRLKTDGLSEIKMKGLPIKTNWNLIYHGNQTLSPAGQKYLEYILKFKEDTMKRHFNGL